MTNSSWLATSTSGDTVVQTEVSCHFRYSGQRPNLRDQSAIRCHSVSGPGRHHETSSRFSFRKTVVWKKANISVMLGSNCNVNGVDVRTQHFFADTSTTNIKYQVASAASASYRVIQNSTPLPNHPKNVLNRIKACQLN